MMADLAVGVVAWLAPAGTLANRERAEYHPGIRVILPTPEGIRSVKITDLMPLGAVWSATEGTRSFDPAIFEDAPDS